MMVRPVLISALLIASSIACAPHSPRRPSRPVPPKDCPALAPWSPTECKTELDNPRGTYECTPFTANPTTFTCTGGSSPVVYGELYKFLNSITCDRTTGGWVYDTDDGDLTDKMLETVAGQGPYMFACAKANQ